jgi:hypothetical protein
VGTPGKSEKLETPENSGDRPGMPEQHSPDAVGASGFSPRMIRGPSARQSGLPGLSVPPAGHRQVPEGETLTTPGAQSPDIPAEALAEVSELSTDLETTAPGAQSVLGNSFVEEKQAPLAERHNDLQAFSSVDSTRNPAFGVSPTGPSSRQRSETSGETALEEPWGVVPRTEVAVEKEAQISAQMTPPKPASVGESGQEAGVS